MLQQHQLKHSWSKIQYEQDCLQQLQLQREKMQSIREQFEKKDQALIQQDI